MAKKMTKRKKPAKKVNELAKRDKPESSETLATFTRNGKKVSVKRWHLTGIHGLPVLIAGSGILKKEQKDMFELRLTAIRVAITSDSKNLQDEAIGDILGELVIGAYQDRLMAYGIMLTDQCTVNTEKVNEIQKVRQTADTHLLSILKAVRDIKRPPVTVVVKEAEQVNVAEQINQADKQVNIAKKQPS